MSSETTTNPDDYAALIRESAQGYVRSADVSARAKKFQIDRMETGGLDRTAWKDMAELGWLGLMAPAGAGGSGLTLRELAVLHEELGRSLVPEPLIHAAFLPIRTLTRCPGVVANNLIGAIADGQKIVPVAWQWDTHALSCEATAVQAESHGSAIRLSGKARYVPFADSADMFLVAARGSGGIGLFVVPKSAKGLTIETAQAADATPMAQLTFENVALDEAAQIGRFETGGQALDDALDEARIALSAEMLGLMQGAFDRTLDYLRTRKQFDRPIGSFQALQHRAVDLYSQIELSRAAVDRAVRVFGESEDRMLRAEAASAAKARASSACLIVTRESIQLHGAIAYTEEYDIGLFVRRALVQAASLGNASAHCRRFGILNLPHLAA